MLVMLISVSHDTIVSNKHEEQTRHYYVNFQQERPMKNCCSEEHSGGWEYGRYQGPLGHEECWTTGKAENQEGIGYLVNL